MRVTLIGAGGIGSHLVDWVARYLSWDGVGHVLTVVDGDTYEDRNRERQAFEAPGMKAQVTAESLSRRYPNLSVEAVCEYLQPDNADFILLEGEIVLLGVDNHPTRKLVSETAARRRDISVISGGNDLEIGTVQIYLRRNGEDATPSLTQDHPEIAEPAGKAPHEMSCEELAAAGVKQILFANLTAAVLMANAFWRLASDPEGFLSKVRGGLITRETAYTEVCFDIEANLVQSRKHPVQSRTDQNLPPIEEKSA